ncbi:alpha/beta hydrolase [Francisella philomiragia]|uniref:alpha/beta hydrolase n=1 Tax=Francisella philomiragia TaxID=28110 RepID=UPI001C9D7EEA|nr:alpha/beta fold hydrolase [Francisella philomiragia]MBY7733944.1 lysophospholipase [Francisella philomiragia]
MKRKACFYSDGNKISAEIYFPNNISKEGAPAIVMCHGFAEIKEHKLPPIAEFFSSNGYIVATFDHRGFGESEGIKGYLVPQDQVNDIRNMITYLQTLPEVNHERIGLWGSSFGGANSIVTTGVDKRVKCLCAQVTFGNGERVFKKVKDEKKLQMFNEMISKASRLAVLENSLLRISANQILADKQSIDFYNSEVVNFPHFDVDIPLLSIEKITEYFPEDYVSKIKIPIFIVSAKNDTVVPVQESEILFEKANEPKQYHCVDTGHYDVYVGDCLKEISNKQLEWFNKYL